MTKKRRVRVYKKGKKSYQAGGQPQQNNAQIKEEQQQQLVFAVMQELSTDKTPEEVIELLQKQLQLEENEAIQIVKTAMDVLVEQKQQQQQTAEFQGHEQEQQMMDQLNDPQGMSGQPMARMGGNKQMAKRFPGLDIAKKGQNIPKYQGKDNSEVPELVPSYNFPYDYLEENVGNPEERLQFYGVNDPNRGAYPGTFDYSKELLKYSDFKGPIGSSNMEGFEESDFKNRPLRGRKRRRNLLKGFRKDYVDDFKSKGQEWNDAVNLFGPGGYYSDLLPLKHGGRIPMHQAPPGEIWNDSTVGPVKDNWRDWGNLYPNVSSELKEGLNLLNLSPEGVKKLTGMSLDELFKSENVELLKENGWTLGENYPPKQQTGGSLPKHQKIGSVKNFFKPPISVPKPNINPVRNFSRNVNPVRSLNTLHPNINPLWFAFGDRAPGPMLLKSMNKLYPFGTNLSGFNPENPNIDPNLLYSTFTNIEDIYKYQGLDTRGSHSSRFLENINSNEPIGSPVPYPNILDTEGLGYWSGSGMPQDNVRVFGATYPNSPFHMQGTGISLNDPNLNLHRRLPFSEKYIPIDKQKMLNDEFQWATSLGNAQSLLEKYGITATAATILGLLGGDTDGDLRDEYNKITIDPLIDYGNKAWDFLQGLPEKQEGGPPEESDKPQSIYDVKKNKFIDIINKNVDLNEIDEEYKSLIEDADVLEGMPYPMAKKGGQQWMQRASKSMKKRGTVGSFAKYCGGKVTLDCIRKGLKSKSKSIRKKAAFAKASWKVAGKMQMGGNLPMYQNTGQVDNTAIYNSSIETAVQDDYWQDLINSDGFKSYIKNKNEVLTDPNTVIGFGPEWLKPTTGDSVFFYPGAYQWMSPEAQARLKMWETRQGTDRFHLKPNSGKFVHKEGWTPERLYNKGVITRDPNAVEYDESGILKDNFNLRKDGGEPCFECGGNVYEDGGELMKAQGGWWDGWKKKRQDFKNSGLSYKNYKKSKNPYSWGYLNEEKNIYDTDINPETDEEYTQSNFDLKIDPSSKFTRKQADIDYTKEYFNTVEQMPDFKTKTVSGVNKKGDAYTRQVSALEEGDVGYGTGEYKSPDLTSEFDPWEYYDMNDPRLDPTSDQYDPNFDPMVKEDKETYAGDMTLEGDPRNKSKFGMGAKAVGSFMKDQFLDDPTRSLGMIASFTGEDNAYLRSKHAGSTMGQIPDHQYRQALVNRHMEEPFTRGQTDPNNFGEFIPHIGQGTHSLSNAATYAQLGAQVGDEIEMSEEELRKFISMGGEVEILNY